MGAERKYDRDVMVPAICLRLANGEPMTVVCRDLGISVKTVNDWRLTDDAIRAQFDEARDLGYDALAWRSHLRARGLTEDGKPRPGKDSAIRIARDKLACDVDEKLRAKWDPRRYGERIKQEISGPNDGPVEVADASAKLLDMLDRRAAAASSS